MGSNEKERGPHEATTQKERFMRHNVIIINICNLVLSALLKGATGGNLVLSALLKGATGDNLVLSALLKGAHNGNLVLSGMRQGCLLAAWWLLGASRGAPGSLRGSPETSWEPPRRPFARWALLQPQSGALVAPKSIHERLPRSIL